MTIRSSTGDTLQICTTDEHPFWVHGRGWRPARFLRTGDRLGEVSGRDVYVMETLLDAEPEGATVYNVEIEHNHTYFVQDAVGTANVAIWVHNLCLYESIQDQFGRIGKVLALVNPADLLTGTRASDAARALVRAVGQAFDDAGHLIARRLGGPGDILDNIIAQNRRINRGAFRVFEGDIAKYIEDNVVEALIEVVPKYIDDIELRPNEIEYIVEFADGTIWRRIFPN